MFNVLKLINTILMTIVSVFYFNQIFNLFVSLFTKKKKQKEAKVNHKYAYLICARNEENVIGNLIDSIKNQDYPDSNMIIFVTSDNSTDATAKVAKSKGAIVFERYDKELIGKSYAMDWSFKKIMSEYKDLDIDAFIILDADNLVSKDFTLEMNKAYDEAITNNKTKIITGFRAPKNFKASWVAAGSGYLLLRENYHMHHSRSILNNGTYVSGTGYLIDYDYIKEFGGWPYHTLVEDIEVSTDMTINGEKIGYCESAVFFDDQPKRMKYSWRQRMRWCKGTHQVFSKYGFKLFKSLIKKPSLTKWGMFVHIIPLPAISFIWIMLLLIIGGVYSIITNVSFSDYFNNCMIIGISDILAPMAFTLFVGAVAIIQGWKKINANAFYKIFYLFLFPIFMVLYLPITTISLFINVKWKQIKHSSYYDKKKIEKEAK